MDTRLPTRTQFVRTAHLRVALLAAALSLQSAGFAASVPQAARAPLAPVGAAAAIDSTTLPPPLLVAPISCGNNCGFRRGDVHSPLETPAVLSPPMLVAPRCPGGGCTDKSTSLAQDHRAVAPVLFVGAATARQQRCEPWPSRSSAASSKTSDRDGIRCPFEVGSRQDRQRITIAGGEPPIVVDACAARKCQG